MKGWEGAGSKGALILAPRCRLRKSRRVNPMEAPCGRRGAWELLACASAKSRARRLRGPGRIPPRPPALAQPCAAQAALSGPRRSGPGAPRSSLGQWTGARRREPGRERRFLDLFFPWQCVFVVGALPIYFPLTSCWRSSSEGGSGGRSGPGRDADRREDLRPERGGTRREVDAGPAEEEGEAEATRLRGAAGWHPRGDTVGSFACRKL